MKQLLSRDSKIELLRIISIFMIVMNHSVSHGIFEFHSFVYQDVTWQLCCATFLSHFGDIGNGVFMLLTGFFFHHNSVKDIKYETISNLIVKMSFYSVSIYFILFLMCDFKFSFKDTVISLFPYLFGLNWYLCCYLIIVLFAPILVKIVDSLEMNKLSYLIIGIFVLKFFMPLFKISTYMPYSHDFYHFSFMFLDGACIHKAKIGHIIQVNKNCIYVLFAILFILLLVSSFGILYLSRIFASVRIFELRTYFRSFIVNAFPIC